MRSYARDKKNKIAIGALCAIVLLMVVGYAAFSTVLNIHGTSNITSNFKVEMTDIATTIPEGSTATNTVIPEIDQTTKLSATFNASLIKPGDSINYDITVENKGNLDAVLNKITLSRPNNDAINFEVTGIEEGDILYKSGETGDTTILTVTVTYKSSVTSQPTSNTGSLTIRLDYGQAGVPSNIVSTAGQKIINSTTIASSGSGLYTSDTEGRYFYKGANPDNYLTYDGKSFRIISIEPDGALKVVATASIPAEISYDQVNVLWDETTSANWARPSTLNTHLNNTTNGYITTFTDSSYIIEHAWNIGTVPDDETSLSNTISLEQATTWTGKIALPTVSEYLRADSDVDHCGSISDNDSNARDGQTCYETNYLAKLLTANASGNDYFGWLLTPANSTNVYSVIGSDVTYGAFNGSIVYDYPNEHITGAAGCTTFTSHPTFYLSPDITLSGSGTSLDPYVVE